MPDHAAYLDRFAHALMTPADEPPQFEGGAARVRAGLDVYRNNVFHSLTEALGDTYPVVKGLVGCEYFRALAREYVRAEPPEGPVLAEYGAGFPAFLESFPPVREVTYLADVARLERAWIEAFHSADAAPLEAQALAGLTPEESAALTLRLHPAARAAASPFPVLTIWEGHHNPNGMPEIDLALGAEEAVVTRPMDEVTVWRVPRGTCALFHHLSEGAPLGSAFGAIRTNLPDFDLGPALGLLIQAGAFADCIKGQNNG
ncbi:MAG: DUF2063 domain-containing protein [Alphaproteobacteria bacterium]